MLQQTKPAIKMFDIKQFYTRVNVVVLADFTCDFTQWHKLSLTVLIKLGLTVING